MRDTALQNKEKDTLYRFRVVRNRDAYDEALENATRLNSSDNNYIYYKNKLYWIIQATTKIYKSSSLKKLK